MKHIIMSMIILAVVGQVSATDKTKTTTSKKSLPRESFEKRYHATFGQKPSDKIWTLGMNPQCKAACGGGTHCSSGTCRGKA